MTHRILVSALLSAALASVSSGARGEAAHDLMPAPASVEMRDGGFTLGESLVVTRIGPTDDRIERALRRFAARVSTRIGRPLALELAAGRRRRSLTVRCEGEAGAFPSLGDDESYRLEVAADRVALEAPGPLGVLRGLATLAQLVVPQDEGWALRAATIHDAPRFPWRGLMIDVVRHWQPMEVIERNLDAMEAVKLNVLHLHLTDDQGFRVESRTRPLLHERGSDGGYYSQDQVRHLLELAADRGIRIVPEFDVPGHATSWLVAYPELTDPPAEALELPRGLGLFANALDPTREETYAFLDTVFGEMADLFPDAFFHVGGDEVQSAGWLSNERIQAFMEQQGMTRTRELQAHFTSRVLPLVRSHGKVPVGWDEIARVELDPDTVVQVWVPGADPGPARSVVSEGFYLDRMRSAGYHHRRDPLDALPPHARPHLLGGEACMWTEFATPDTIDSRVWPRAAAIAERLWSPREVADGDDMRRRLALVRADLTRLGLRHDAYYEPALAALTGGTLSPALETLADVSGPPNVLERIFSYEALGAMVAPSFVRSVVVQPEIGTRFEDVLQPESDAGSAFLEEAVAWLASPTPDLRARLDERLRTWRDNQEAVVDLIDEYPGLEEIEPVSEGLARLAAVGLETLEVLDGKAFFSERDKRLHLELLALHDPRPLDLADIDFPEDQEMIDALPEIFGRLLRERLMSGEPLILFRVKAHVQPGIERLVLAAHAMGTRETGPVEDAAWSLYDHRWTLLTVLFAAALLALVVRRRRRKRAASPPSS